MKKPSFFSYLPSKKFAAIVFFLTLSAGALFYLGKFVELKPNLNTSLKNIINQGFVNKLAEKTEILDSDSDGLKDWEEMLWGTDINNPDTDKDGSSDKQEADNGYDPLDPFSNEKTGKKIEKVNYPAVADNLEPGNLTQSLAQSIGMKIMNGTNANPLSVSDALNSINQETSQGLVEFEASFHKTVYDSELKISNDDSPAALEKYIQEASNVLSKDPIYIESTSQYSPFSNEMISANGINLSIIDEYIVYIDQAIKDFKNISVPPILLQFHKKETELLISNKEVFLNIRKIEEDPLRAMLAINQFEKNISEMKNSGVSLVNLSGDY